MFNLIVRARHYKETEFGKHNNCPFSAAANEQFASSTCTEGVKEIQIEGQRFIHRHYTREIYDEDKREAWRNGYDETIIRKVKLMR